jgi:hypothetical protein
VTRIDPTLGEVDPTMPRMPRRTRSWAAVPAEDLTALDERGVARLERDCDRGYVDAVEARARLDTYRRWAPVLAELERARHRRLVEVAAELDGDQGRKVELLTLATWHPRARAVVDRLAAAETDHTTDPRRNNLR